MTYMKLQEVKHGSEASAVENFKLWQELEELKWSPVDGSLACGQQIKNRYADAVTGSSIVLEGFEDRLAEWDRLSIMIEELSTRKRKIEQEIQMVMKHKEHGITDTHTVNWKNVTSVRLDVSELKKRYPAIYNAFSKEVTTRRFQIKAS